MGHRPLSALKFPGIDAGWDNGFYIRSQDKHFSLRITGQLQADYRWYGDADDITDTSGFILRRARFGLEATLFQFYDFRFMPDFGSGQTRILDGYMNIRYWEAVQFTAGKFKQPFSYEQLIQDRYTPLMERSLIDQLVPARDVGVMIHGQNLANGRLDYAIAVPMAFRTVTQIPTTRRIPTPESQYGRSRPGTRRTLRRLQIGISGGWGVQNEPVNPSTLHTPAGVTYFRFNRNVIADGVRSRFSPEVAYFAGGFGTSAQYFHMEQKLRPGLGEVVRVPYDGFYVQATYLLTGEEPHRIQPADCATAAIRPPTGLPRVWGMGSRGSSIVASGR